MKLSEYDNCRRTRGSRRLPRSVQQSIPIDCIYQDGVWRSGDVYNKAWSVSDVNYAMLSDQSKKEIQTLYGTVYAGLPADCWAQFCVTSQRMDEAAFRRDVLMQVREDNGDIYRAEYNALLENRVRDLGNTRQQKFLIVSTNKPNIQQARERLRHVQGHLVSALSALGCTVREVDNNERLRVLHGFFRAGEEQQFRFDWGKSSRLGHDFKDAICPDSMVFRTDHIEIDRRYAKVLSLMQYPQRLDDSLIPALLRQAPRMALSIHVLPIEPEDAAREIDNARMRVDADKVRFNRKSVDNLDFTSSVPYRTRAQDAVVAEWQDGVSNRDQQMFLTLLTVVCFADSLEELTREVDAIKTQAVNLNCRFIDLKYQQENAFNTTMPYGLRRIENMRTMLTEDVAALVPFHTQEVLDPGGIYYGVNAMSGNLIIGSRALLVNGNGMVIATSGGGKSMFAKAEILARFLRFPLARFYLVDPEREYCAETRALGGVVVDISVDSRTYFNPLDFVYDPVSKIPPHTAKAEFVLSLCEQVMGKEHLLPGDKSLIDRSLKRIYQPFVKRRYQGVCPTLTDLWRDLNAQDNERAKEIALALEIFANGSLNMFAQPTNVDMSNRLICFNIQSLGDQLKSVAMLSMLEFINTQVMQNDRSDPDAATWVYFDEIYLLLRNELSAHFLYVSWKRFRKYNAYATGITQSVQDCLSNDTAYAMLANSEFVVLLRQTKDIDSVAELYGLSEPQKNYLLLARPGQGILKLGNSLIPFENEYPKNKTYQLLTTKPGEMEQ